MKTKNKIISLITLLLFLTACTNMQTDFTQIQIPGFENKEITGEQEFQKGIEGLNIRFVKEATAKEIREGSFFNIIFEMQNKGYSDINEGLFKIITEEEYVKIEKNKGTIMLKGKNQYSPTGELKRLSIPAKAQQIDKNLKEMPIKTTMVVCYAYETILSEAICIDSDIEGIKKNKACTTQTVNFAGQGAPVVITKIIPKINIRERGIVPEFEIHIENKGEGQVIAEQFIEHACGSKSRERIEDYDKIEISAELSNKRLKCSPSKITIKKGKEIKIICEQETALKKNDAYLAPLQIRIKYGYLTSAHGDLKITKRLKN